MKVHYSQALVGFSAFPARYWPHCDSFSCGRKELGLLSFLPPYCHMHKARFLRQPFRNDGLAWPHGDQLVLSRGGENQEAQQPVRTLTSAWPFSFCSSALLRCAGAFRRCSQISACSYCALRSLGDSNVETAHGMITGRGWSGHSRNKQHGLRKQRLPPRESLEIKKKKGGGEAAIILWLLGIGWPLGIGEQMSRWNRASLTLDK